MAFIGSHCILELYGCPAELLDDETAVLEAVRGAAAAGRCTILGEVANRFEPQGVTALALLSESHISVHTWPELSYAACDVFTCGENAAPQAACAHLARALKAARHELRIVERGELPSTRRPPRAPATDEVA